MARRFAAQGAQVAYCDIDPGDVPDGMMGVAAEGTSLRTWVTAEDIADMVLFVTSDAGKRISGQTLAVDGHTERMT